jgi:hypothetical protein
MKAESGFGATGPAWRTIAVALAVLGLCGMVGCSSAAEPNATPTALPPQVAAMWAEHRTWVNVAPPTDTYVPGPDTPRSVRIEALMLHGTSDSASAFHARPGALDAAQTLYADPTSPEPWADRAVMVGRVAGSDTDGMFAPFKDSAAATIQGSKGHVGRDGDLWFASWPIPTPTCEVCDQEGFVIGHGLTKARVLAIAETVDQKPAPHADEATLPEGLQVMGSAPGAQGSMSVGVLPEELAMRSGDTTATFQIWSGDPRLYAHLAFWANNGKPIETWRRGWTQLVRQDDLTVLISNDTDSDPPEGDVDALRAAAAALVPGDAAAVKIALADAVKNLEPLPDDRNLCEGGLGEHGVWTTLSGVVAELRWGLTLQVANGIADYCDDLWFAASGGGPSGGGGGALGRVPSGGVRFAGTGTTGTGDGNWVTLVAGDVPDSAVRVVVTSGGQSTEAELAGVGPEPGRRWFAAAFLSAKMSRLNTADVVAYDTAGDPVATGTQG